MHTAETYRPANIEFDVNNGVIPLNLGLEFKDMNQAINFIGSKLISFNQKVRANRFMDNFEKHEIRKDYQELLENKIPMLEKELMKAQAAHAEAKKALADANEYVSATTNEAKAMAVEVKRGIKEIELDDMYTWSIPVGDKYYFFTFIDSQIKLCKVSDIPFHERSEIFNAMTQNEEFFKKYFPDGLQDCVLVNDLKEKLNE
jgi:hypothetical protein